MACVGRARCGAVVTVKHPSSCNSVRPCQSPACFLRWQMTPGNLQRLPDTEQVFPPPISTCKTHFHPGRLYPVSAKFRGYTAFYHLSFDKLPLAVQRTRILVRLTSTSSGALPPLSTSFKVFTVVRGRASIWRHHIHCPRPRGVPSTSGLFARVPTGTSLLGYPFLM